MDSINFEIILNFAMGTRQIKPPTSFNSLLEIAKEAFDLTIVNQLAYYDNSEEVKISNDTDYFNMFNFVDETELKEIEIYIKSDESKNKRKKSTQLRKRSSALRPPVGSISSSTHEDNCINGKYLILYNSFFPIRFL